MNLRNNEYDDPPMDYVASATKHSGASPQFRQKILNQSEKLLMLMMPLDKIMTME